jgi:Xaa-Pro aminopeptidase
MMDVGASWEGYCADVTRTFVVGTPSQRQREVYDVVALALREVTEMSRPGVRASQLHRHAVQVLEAHGLGHDLAHRVGHGIGLETSLEPPDLRRDELPLEPGMTFCLEPGVYLPGFGGIKIEDDVIVQEDGPEVISYARRDLVAV